MAFEVTSELPQRISPGLMITYRVRPLLGLGVEWVTEITHVEEGVRFIDEQRLGPYRLWHHEHSLRAATGGTEVHDLVRYALPFGRAGELAHPLVQRRLKQIFNYRSAVLARTFGDASEVLARTCSSTDTAAVGETLHSYER
jgi:ligand-binding SRPBCC domain-containing protein